MNAVAGMRVEVEPVMGTSAAIRVVGSAHTVDVDEAIADCFAELREVERIFSTYREDSDVSRIRRGELSIEDADPLVAIVAAACRRATTMTRGRFSAEWRGGFDPTGYVKGWAAEQAAANHLAPLLGSRGIDAVGIGVGGDIRVMTAAGSDWIWRVGIADPSDVGRTLATVPLLNGAVATSGASQRGAHILDPRTRRPPIGVASATVVAESLADADVWATSAVVAGFDDLGWLVDAPQTNGILVGEDGRIRRWAAGVEISITSPDDWSLASGALSSPAGA